MVQKPDSIINLVFLYKMVSFHHFNEDPSHGTSMFLINCSEENAYMHTSETGVGGMANRKERPCCWRSPFQHTYKTSKILPTFFSFPLFSYILIMVFQKVHLIFRRTNVTCESLCFASLIILCIAFCIIQPRSRFFLVAMYNFDGNGMLQAVLIIAITTTTTKKGRGKKK